MESVHVTGAREAAFRALLACEKRKGWSDSSLHAACEALDLSPRDASLAAQLCYGVLQNRILLDFWICRFSKRPASELDAEILLALRLGLYQIRFLDRVPSRAAVNESVNLARKYAENAGASGFVNAVLRAFLRAGDPPMPPQGDLATRYSHPPELVSLLASELDGDVEPLLAANNRETDICIQVNTLRTTTSDLREAMCAQGLDVRLHPWLQDCLLIRKGGRPDRMEPFQKGLFYVQDAAARLVVLASGVRPGDRVLDACAAPGGKSFSAAIQMMNQGVVLSGDIHEKKLNSVRSGAARMGLSCIQTSAADARTFQPELADRFDAVLADVPCSGLGVIRKKPEIRYRNPKQTEALPTVQSDVLQTVARYVRPGGVLVYSTCTVLRRENQDVIEAFLQKRSDFCLEPFVLPRMGPVEGSITLWPHLHGTDGFFMAKLRREYAKSKD